MRWQPTLVLLAALTACGDDGAASSTEGTETGEPTTETGQTTTADASTSMMVDESTTTGVEITWEVTPADGTTIGEAQMIVIRFSASTDPDSLTLGGSMAPESSGGVFGEEASPDDRLTISPSDVWSAGPHTLTVGISGAEGEDVVPPIDLTFDVNVGAFVDDDGDDANPGTSAAPVATIQRGIEIATGFGLPMAEVFVAEGTYSVDDDNPLVVSAGISIRGGYVDGDWGTRGALTEIIGSHTTPGTFDDPNVTMRLDGADGEIDEVQIGGAGQDENVAALVEGAATVRFTNVTVSMSGGLVNRGVYVTGEASPTIDGSEIVASGVDGAIGVWLRQGDGDLVISDTNFLINDASGRAAVNIEGGTLDITGCSITNSGFIGVEAAGTDVMVTADGNTFDDVANAFAVGLSASLTATDNEFTDVRRAVLAFNGANIVVRGGSVTSMQTAFSFSGAPESILIENVDIDAVVGDAIVAAIDDDVDSVAFIGNTIDTTAVAIDVAIQGGDLNLESNVILATEGDAVTGIQVSRDSAEIGSDVRIHGNDIALLGADSRPFRILATDNGDFDLFVYNNAVALPLGDPLEGIEITPQVDLLVNNNFVGEGIVRILGDGGPGDQIVHNNIFMLDQIACINTLVEPLNMSIHNNSFFDCIELLGVTGGPLPPLDLDDPITTIDGAGTMGEWGNIIADPMFADAIEDEGAAQLPAAGSDCDLRQGGMDGNAEGWGFNVDLAAATRTPNDTCGPANTDAAGWSIGPLEQDN